MVKRVLDDIGINPAMVELEITESVAMEGALAMEHPRPAQSLGRIAGNRRFWHRFSSLSYLQKLNVDRLKIDRAFVAHIDSTASRTSIAEMIVRLGQNLSMTVIAEGVETEAGRRSCNRWVARRLRVPCTDGPCRRWNSCAGSGPTADGRYCDAARTGIYRPPPPTAAGCCRSGGAKASKSSALPDRWQ